MYAQQNLNQIAVGMEVYDIDGVRIGTVDGFRAGEGTIKTNNTDIKAIVDAVSEVLGGRKDLPMVLYRRLYAEGFVSINRGWWKRSQVAFLKDIDEMSEDAIVLNVDQRALPST